MIAWLYHRGVWISGPWTVRLEVCPRWKLTYFELFDATRFVKSFASVQEAQKFAEDMQHVAMQRAS